MIGEANSEKKKDTDIDGKSQRAKRETEKNDTKSGVKWY